MKRWKDSSDAISPIFKFSSIVRKVIYTTNAIESLELHLPETKSSEKHISKQYNFIESPIFATFEATKKWTTTSQNWGHV